MAQCIVSGTLTNLTGAPIASATVIFRLDQGANDVTFKDGNAITEDEHVELTDEYGNFSVSLTQGTRVLVRIDKLRLHRQVLVPESATATLEELLDGDL
jgi:hypothetical protein